MSSNIDFKALWQQQPASDKPDINAVIKKAMNLRLKARNKLIWINVVLIATTILIIVVGINLNTHVMTTTIGIMMMIFSIIGFVAVSNGLFLYLFKSHPEADTFSYLGQLVSIQKKQQFIQAKVIRLYFVFLALGLFLYMIEFEKRMSLLWAIVTFLCTFGWLAFAYFYMQRKQFKKQQAEMDSTIARLQAINQQLLNGKQME